MAAKRKRVQKPVVPPEPVRVQIGGQQAVEGFVLYDPSAKPAEASSVDQMLVQNLHQSTQEQRYVLMNDAWRALKPGAQITIMVPYWSSEAAFADPKTRWPPFSEKSFFVYSKVWRAQSGNADLPLTCDFANLTPDGQVTLAYGHETDLYLAGRNDEFVEMAKRHNVNAIHTLHVTLTRQP